MTTPEMLQLINNVSGAFFPYYRETMLTALNQHKMRPPDWGRCFMAWGVAPKPLTLEIIHTIHPYTSSAKHEENYDDTVNQGFLEKNEAGYSLTDAGNAGMTEFYKAASNALSTLVPLPDDKMRRLTDLLAKIIHHTEKADRPNEKAFFLMSRRSDPGNSAPSVIQIDQYLTDLARLRDDAHLAAWKPYGVTGCEWEAFSNVWNGNANTATALAERYASFRGIDEAEYSAALQALVAKGWLSESDGVFAITEKGKQLRDSAEDETNANYFVGWQALNEAEQAELNKLLTKLGKVLPALSADKVAKAHGDLNDIFGELSQAIFGTVQSKMGELWGSAGISERGLPFALIQAFSLDPKPITGATITRRFPYGNASRWDDSFAGLTEKELMTHTDDGFTLTEKGRTVMEGVLATFSDHLAEVAERLEMPAEKLERLVELLAPVINTALQSNDPPGAWCLKNSHQLFSTERSTLAKIDQYVDDFNAFRDDAHLASFRDLEIAGNGWELFGDIWRKQFETVPQYVEKKQFRGYDEAAYQAALNDLVARGWVTVSEDGDATMTSAGTTVREKAEQLTDRYFYSAWVPQRESNITEIRELIQTLMSNLKAITPQD